MRVSDRFAHDQIQTALSKNRGSLADLQNKLATQKQVTKPSDDPLAATRVLGFKTENKAIQQFIKTSNMARSYLEYADQSLNELTDVLVRVKELVLNQSNDASAGSDSRRLVAQEIAQLQQQAIQIGNRKLGERYIFGGYNITKAPFAQNGGYQGDTGEVHLEINKDATLAVNIPGNQIFTGEGGRPGSPRALKEVTPKTIEDLAVTRQQAQQLQAGQEVDSAQPSQGGQEVRGPASIQSAATSTQQTTQETVPVKKPQEEGVNIFNTLKSIEIAMRTNNKYGLQDAINEVDEAVSQVILARSTLGSRLTSLQSNLDSLRKSSVDTQGAASELEDADTFEVVSGINQAETTLKATMASASKLIQPSLLDFLR